MAGGGGRVYQYLSVPCCRWRPTPCCPTVPSLVERSSGFAHAYNTRKAVVVLSAAATAMAVVVVVEVAA